MLNRVVLVGRLTRDPDLRVSQNNISVGNFTLAVNRPFTDQNGERGADFINCVVFRKQAENVQKFVQKGSLVGVDGRLQSRSYENKDGQRVYVTEVVCDNVHFLEPKGRQQGSNQAGNAAAAYPSNSYGSGNQSYGSRQEENPFANSTGNVDISDDDLPF